jgi:phage repressor protein C with HTH and peptisase S24 domain
MNLSQAYEALQTLTNAKIIKADIARAFNIDSSNLSRKERNGTELKLEEIKKINKLYNVNLLDKNAGVLEKKSIDTFSAKYFPDVLGSCGFGAFEQSQKYEMLSLPKKLVMNYSDIKTYSIINAHGDSMNPTIEDADKLIVETSTINQIIDNKIYIFCYEDKIFVKRLVKNIDELVVISDNPDKSIYKTSHILKNDMENVYIYGQVVGLVRNFVKG